MEEQNVDGVCDGGDLDCGSGLLLIIKKAMDPIREGGILEIRSREPSVEQDLPAWCRMVGHSLVAVSPHETHTSYLVQKGAGQSDVQSDLDAARGYRWSVRVRAMPGLTAQVFARNHSFTAGQPADFSAKVEAPSAMDLLLAALGSDLVVGLRAAASRENHVLDEVECVLRASLGNVLAHLGIEDGDPSVQNVSGTIYIATVEDEASIHGLWQSVLAHSPLYQTLSRAAQIDIRCEVTL
ncbi:MAG: sulfurtransferase TusA family protein [Firmicutes bacterium]|nr:sulfurtransferase TusA family protein [Bacillota bacterium]